jgi:gliding motility-associated-like protein
MSLSLDNAGNLYVLDQDFACVRKVDGSGIITTIIPTASITGQPPTGDGGPLSAATFTTISSFVPDNAGNFYISDANACRVRKVNASGIITTIAGTGVAGFSGDGGPATSAQLTSPYAVSFDQAGNIYITDVGNSRIRKIDAAGIITTVAGNGTQGSSGDGGPALDAELNTTLKVVLDNNGNMYLDDAGNYRVRKIDATGIISAYAGTGAFGYSGDGGPATAAEMTSVSGIALDNGGNLYIADERNYVIRKVINCLSPQISQQPAGSTICAGGNASFTMAATGSTAYQWQVNSGSGWNNLSDGGVYAGTATNTLTITSAVAGMNMTQYQCAVVNVCGTFTTVPAILTVNTPSAPTVTIATTADVVCAGTTASFTASSTNGGATPVYQWLVNGLPVGASGATYVNATMNDGDAISCVMTSDAACITVPTAVSNTIVEQVQAAVSSSVSIDASATTICSGAEVTFTATAVNGGSSPAYQWLINGADVGAGKSVFTDNDLANGDMVSCMVTSSLSCSAPAASQNQVQMTVNANPSVVLMPDTIIALGQSVTLQANIAGPVTSYEWTPAAGLDNPITAAPVATPENTTTYQVIVSTDANCTASGKVTVGVFKPLKMPEAFTPNGDGKNDLFRIPPSLAVQISSFAVFDRWGTRVFYTTNSAGGWDGTLRGQPQPMGTYVWMIEYQDLLTGRPSQAQGTVILIR